MRFLYELIFALGFLCYAPLAVWRRRLPHRGWSMRLGRYPASVRDGVGGRQTVWVHAVSVGEVQAARPLLHALLAAHPQDRIVLSTITHSGFAVAQQQASERVIPIYFPLDLRGCVRRALNTMHPRLLVLMESELWPVMIDQTRARQVPVVVVNGRVSTRAFRRYQLVKPVLRAMMRQVNVFLVQTQRDADRVIDLGAPSDRVRITGSLKWDASIGTRPTPDAIRRQAAWIGLTPQDPVLVAGSTHRGEEEPLLRTFTALRRTYPRARLILAPRHLERLGEVDDLVQRVGLTPQHLSQEAGGHDWDVGIVDTFGQLPLYYGLASAVFIGGSLIPHGGQNPLEAASLGKPIVFGPYMYNFLEIAEQLVSHRAARQLTGETELLEAFTTLCSDSVEAAAMGRRAQDVVERSRGATRRTLEALEPLLR